MEYLYSDDLSLYAHLFHEGKNIKSYEFLGAHIFDNKTRFCLWAPNAKYVNLVGDFNNWDDLSLPMQRINNSGIWEITLIGNWNEANYKYRIVTKENESIYKADPYAFFAELRPKTASRVFDLKAYNWKDKSWMKNRKSIDYNKAPMSIYEVNLASWKKAGMEYLSYNDLAEDLVKYVKSMNYTHVEIMPVMEYPYDGSWGYQLTGYYAVTSRFGNPKDFMNLVNAFHKAGIGVILDWVPVHFCKDDHGLVKFDGSSCFESGIESVAYNKNWDTYNFDYTRREVVNFLISSALFWFDYYHIDGLRVDAVAYMLYKETVNEGEDNLNYPAIEFIKELNSIVFENYPDVLMIAEESTAFEGVTKSVKDGGLGFSYKWNMGWMNDTIKYMNMDPYFRSKNHNLLTFSIMYAFSEKFCLPFSHDEVVHAKGSMLNTMFGEYDDRFRQLRLLYLYMFAHPGKKLNFMGNDFAQFDEWNEWGELSWNLFDFPNHEKFNNYFKELNKIYTKEKSLYEVDHAYEGFKWLEVDNKDESIIAFERISLDGDKIICILNFTPVERKDHPIGVDDLGNYSILINSNHQKFGGTTSRNDYFKAVDEAYMDKKYKINVDIPGFTGYLIKHKSK